MDIGFPISTGGSGGTSYTEVANFATLPLASTVSGITYLVIATTGVIFINRKLAGLYKSNGITWDYLGDVTSYVNTVGGTTGQVLAKIDSTDFNTQWVTPSAGTTDHTALTNIGTRTHAQLESDIATSSVLKYISATNSYTLQTPDNTTAGGNARGNRAVDLQTSRTNANQVASGLDSFTTGSNNLASGPSTIAVGYNNIASGNYSISIGYLNSSTGIVSTAIGRQGTASGDYGFTIGYATIASGYASIATGVNSTSNGIYSKWVHGSASGFQSGVLNCINTTVDANPKILTSDSGTGSVSNQCTLQNNNAIAFNVTIVARNTATGDCARWEAKGLIKRGANASTTALVGTPTITLTHNDAVAWAVVGAISLTANTTNGALAITVTGAAATTIKWLAKIETTEVV